MKPVNPTKPVKRWFLLVAALAVFATCASQFSKPPPNDQFYFPAGLVHVDSPHSTEGLLYVANANFDKRFENGSIIAINLDKVGLPAFGAPVTTPVSLPLLFSTDAGSVEVASLAGEMRGLDLGDSRVRLFLPTRSEGMRVHAIDAPGIGAAGEDPTLSCFTPAGTDPRDCATNAPSLSPPEFERSAEGIPRASNPYGVGFKPRTCATDAQCVVGTCSEQRCVLRRADGSTERLADVFVTHIAQVDSPVGSGKNARGYLVKLDSSSMTVGRENFIDLGPGASSSVVSGAKWTYVSGRFVASTDNLPISNLLRMVDPDGGVFGAQLEGSTRPGEARGLALSSDEKRVFIAGRTPDSLLVVTLANLNGPGSPSVAAANMLLSPVQSPNEVQVIARPGRGDLVVLTGAPAATAGSGSVAIYDDEVGQIAATVPGVGLVPFEIAVDRRGAGARLFVSDFGDGRIAVIDIPDLMRPAEARLVAHLGRQQLCLTQGQREPSLCDGGVK